MGELALWQYLSIGLLFIWGGFVRSSIGFGGAVLTLPFLLLILNEPLVFLPIIAVHLLVFSALTVWQSHRARHPGVTVNWRFLRHALLVMAIPKAIGLFGVITLPVNVISGFIFVIVSIYAISYILNRPFRSNSKVVDTGLLALGGYVSGASLTAAPLVVPVAINRLPREQVRDTLFVLWFILVTAKLSAFVWAGVDMQWAQHLWLLPCAALGHVLGLRFYQYALHRDSARFFRVLGYCLLTVSAVGLGRMLLPA